ncbi:MAG: inositol monophosphatase family protein [Myxococcaceae bacterium]
MIAELRAAAETISRKAGQLLRDRYTDIRTIEFKGGIDLVTDADKASEREIISFINQRYPDHRILAEESGASGTVVADGFRWVIDPLDGTTNYSHQVPHFCVSVGVEGPGGLLAGVIFDPMSGELFSAGRGQGATVNGAPIRVSTTATIDRALLCTGFPYDVREKPEAPVGLFNRFIRKAQGIRRMGSAALDLAYVAAGRFDGFFEFGLKPWDIAAGALIIEEAGGVASGIRGDPLSLTAGHILACGKVIEPVLREECRLFLDELGWKPHARG